MLNKKNTIDCSTPIIFPNWPAPPNVRAFFTTRKGDPKAQSSIGKYISNLPKQEYGIEPVWLDQTHSAKVHRLTKKIQGLQGDALITSTYKLPCAIKVADCVPILLCDVSGREISAIHAGWRGLLSGIIENSVMNFTYQPSKLLAWVGPSISKKAYPVGPELKEMFCVKNAENNRFFETKNNIMYFDIRAAVKSVLSETGIAAITENARCVFRERDSFYSARREETYERMAAVIWIVPEELKQTPE